MALTPIMFKCPYCNEAPHRREDPFCDIVCAKRWWAQKSTWWVTSIHANASPGPIPQPDKWFMDRLTELMEDTA